MYISTNIEAFKKWGDIKTVLQGMKTARYASCIPATTLRQRKTRRFITACCLRQSAVSANGSVYGAGRCVYASVNFRINHI